MHNDKTPIRVLKEDEVKGLLALTPKDITKTFLYDMFANYTDRPRKYNTGDKFNLPAKKCRNEGMILTTVGRYIFNLFLFENFPMLPYYNKNINEDEIGKINADIIDLLIEDVVTAETVIDWYNRVNFLGLVLVKILNPSIGFEGLYCPPKTKKLRDELFAKYSKELSNGDAIVGAAVEKQLIESAQNELKDTDAYKFYMACKKKPSFKNQFKTMALMRGPVYDPENKKFNICLGNLSEGTPLSEMKDNANLLLAGAGGRALETRLGGYISKQMTAAFQSIVLDEPGSDCGTKETLKIKLTKDIIKLVKLNYIVENGKNILLDHDTLPKYLDKEVHIRLPMFCKGKKFCSKCYGELPYRIGIKNIGLTYNIIGEILKGLSMKSFHDSTVTTSKVDLEASISEL